MNTAAVSAAADPSGFWDWMVSDFPRAVEEWSRGVNRLTEWEDTNLLVEKPAPEILAQHRKRVDRLMLFGQMCAIGATHPDFGNTSLVQIVGATQDVLRTKLHMFHNAMTQEKAEEILAEVFPES